MTPAPPQLTRGEAAAAPALAAALAAVCEEAWKPKTTARNLGLIRAARARRGETLPWVEEIERQLRERLPP